MWTVLCVVNETDEIGGAAPTQQAIQDMANWLRQQFPLAEVKIFEPGGTLSSTLD